MGCCSEAIGPADTTARDNHPPTLMIAEMMDTAWPKPQYTEKLAAPL